MKNIILLILCSFCLIGCSWFDKDDKLPQYVLIAPNDSDLSECPVAPPPSYEEFMKATSVGQMMMMTEAYNKQTKNVNECNIRLYGLKLWKEEQIKNYNNH